MNPLENLQASLADRYKVEREIGVGGMATVYLAKDLRHERDVALKLLKPELGAVLGPERFLSEIRVTAKLQHPNLLPLFDSGEASGQLWYAMPFVEGESLRAKMDRERQLSVREAVRIAVLVAGALDYAHRHGVIHRDLKPENILLHEGQPLVADFGIALAVSNAGGERVTQTGLSLGTPQYMSPEQATGERGVDGRTDIYSLGAVLYEMLTGEPPHTGATVQAIIARLMTDTPRSVRSSRPSVPENVDWAIQKALEKVPADRFDSAKEFAETLEGQRPITSQHQTVVRGERRAGIDGRRRVDSRWLPWIIAGVAGAVALSTTLWALHFIGKSRAVDAEPVRFTITPQPSEFINGALAISPDGRRLVYGVEDPKGSRLYSRLLDDVTAHALPGTEGAESPFFSPDGKWIAYFIAGDLVRAPVDGGSPLLITKNVSAVEAGWATENRIILPTQSVTRQRAGLSMVPATGGVPTVILTSDTLNRENMRAPLELPDGKHFLFTSLGPGAGEDDSLAIGTFGSKEYKRLGVLARAPLGFVDGNAILQATLDGSILAMPINVSRGTKGGDPITVQGGVSGGAALSKNGTLAYVSGASGQQLMWLDGVGKPDTVLSELRAYEGPRLSPDGKRVGVWLPGGNDGDVWIYNTTDKTMSRLTHGNASHFEWTPDGNGILFTRTGTAATGIFLQPGDGSAEARRIEVKFPVHTVAITAVLSPDGKTMLITASTAAARTNIYSAPMAPSTVASPWLATPSAEYAPRFSPDGKFVAYVSDESGTREVYVRPYPGPGGRAQISNGGGMEPLWSRSGHQIFYRNGPRLMAADISGGGIPSVASRRQMLTASVPEQASAANYDVSPDGKRVLMGVPNGAAANLVVVVNWFTEVRRKLAEAGK
ncbi:MAG: serine/threonine-protein kinase [Gemmatimonadaceae bacterium]|nr:serine/threonine-protein kinase [Gemmatimonadaceae bacterium]